MRDYARIACKITETPWLITQNGLEVVLKIFDDHLVHGKLSEEEIDARLAGMGGRNSKRELTVVNGVGVLPIVGPIFGKANLMTQMSGATSLESFRTDFREMMSNDMIHSILLQFDTPGGTSDMVEEVANEIRAARDTKTINSLADSMCGSAGLWLASQGNNFYSTPSGSVGSHGAYTVHQDQSVADANKGIKLTFISAGKYKTEGNPHEPLSDEGKAYRQEVINELMDGFTNGLSLGRGKSTDEILSNFGQGRMLSAKKALDVGMIDGIMPAEQLLGQMVNKPHKVQIQVPETINATGFVTAMVNMDGTIKLEEKDWEHSEPGTGPTPVTDGDERNDPDITSGSRRDTPPAGFPGQEESVMAQEDVHKLFIEKMRAALELKDDVNEDGILTAVTQLHSEIQPLRELEQSVEDQRAFAKKFPDEYARMQKLETRGRKADAHEFAEEYRRFVHTDDTGEVVKTNKGFSSVVIESIETCHLKLAQGEFAGDDLASMLNLIAKTGVVEYGMRGTEQSDEDDTSDEKDPRKAFAARVEGYMVSDNLDRMAALRMAATKHPDEYEAYQNATRVVPNA